jgi:hypothetical protein
MGGTVMLILTEREAEALRVMAGNMADHADAMEFFRGAERAAAVRAYDKLCFAQRAPYYRVRPVLLTPAQARVLLSAADELVTLAEAGVLGEGDFADWTRARVRAIRASADALARQIRGRR